MEQDRICRTAGRRRKFVLIPDSFKGTMTSREICAIMAEAAAEIAPGAEVLAIPVADGGEGTVDAFLAALPNGRRVPVRVSGPFFEPVDSFYGRFGDTAVVETAAAAGLPLAEGRLDPTAATTYGVGELILQAARDGAKRIILGLGGSCTNDGGAGAAAACGVRFYDGEGQGFIPTGGSLCRVRRVDFSGLAEILRGVALEGMCDVENPLYGETGAARVFAPQKGASPAEVDLLDEGLRHLDQVLQGTAGTAGTSYGALPGGGAAGGLGAGLCAFFQGKLKPGLQTVLDLVGFEAAIQGADLILTGEGRLDSQSLRGKVPLGVARAAAPHGVPVVAVVGDIALDWGQAEGLCAVFSINRRAVAFEQAKETAREDLGFTVRSVLGLYGAGRGIETAQGIFNS
jgi:glycerate kinase